MKLGKLSKRREKAGRRTHLPTNILVTVFGGVFLLIVLVTAISPQLYKMSTRSDFENAFFVDSNRDRILNYSTHPALDTIRINNNSFEIVTSQASRRVDEIIVIYNDGIRSTLVVGLVSSLICGVAIAFLVIRAYAKNTSKPVSAAVVGAIILALAFLNWTSATLRSNSDIQAYNVAQPLVGGSLAILAFSSIEQNALELFNEALDRGAQRDAVDKEGSGFVHYAARNNREAMLKKLATFPDVKFDLKNNTGETPVQIAVDKSHAETVQILIDEGADPVNTDSEGRTLLHRAAASNDVPMLTLLLLHTKGLNVFDNAGETPLALAAENLDLATVNLMLDNGADVNALMDDETTFFELTLSKVLELVETRAPLTPSEQDDQVAIVRRMVESGADLTRQDKDGNSPLHHVTRIYDELIREGLTEVSMLSKISAILIDAGAPTGLRNAAQRNAMPLSLVFRLGRDEWLERAIDDNVDRLNTYKIDRVSLFQHAVEHGKADTLKLLLEKGMTTQPWIPDSDDPLRPLILRNDIETAKILLKQGYVTPSRTIVEQDGPLHLAARNDLDEMIELLIDNGYDVNAQGNRGNTPLHYAIEAKALRSLLTLVEHKADPLIWNKDGITPQMAAQALRVRAITDLMKRAIQERDPRRPTPDPPADVQIPPVEEDAPDESQ